MAKHTSQRKSLVLSKEPLPILQDDFSPSKGNALQACVASIFGQPLADVPNFIALECGYLDGIQNYVDDNYTVRKTNLNSSSDDDDIMEKDVGKICILRGKSPRGNFGHVVVATIKGSRLFEFIHDPHPDSNFLDPAEAFGWYIVFKGQVKGNKNKLPSY